MNLANDTSLALAGTLMSDFAQRTGLLDGDKQPDRYLWTDAFAVCNFLTLFQRTGDTACRQQALALIQQVHRVLGQYHNNDTRKGWISRLEGAMAIQHPTAGGLRIGKPQLERSFSEPLDSNKEWDRDGQYFHYLTKWMHALSQAAGVTRDVELLKPALELAQVAHRRFTYATSTDSAPRMYWKMDVNLSRPQVAAMGQHDPLDALLTYRELARAAGQFTSSANLPSLAREINAAEQMCSNQDWTTDDPLGIGGLLFDAGRLAQLADGTQPADGLLLETLLRAAARGLRGFLHSSTLNQPAEYRLAFRELGLAIGLHALPRIQQLAGGANQFANSKLLSYLAEDLLRLPTLAASIEDFWLRPTNQRPPSWTEHHNINTVMLATSLVPEGFLRLSATL
jgi:hypothetical protein